MAGGRKDSVLLLQAEGPQITLLYLLAVVPDPGHDNFILDYNRVVGKAL